MRWILYFFTALTVRAVSLEPSFNIKDQNEVFLQTSNFRFMKEGPASAEKINQAFLQNQDCSDNSLSDMARYGSSQQYTALYNTLQSKRSQCATNLLHNIQETFGAERIPKACQRMQYKNHPTCQKISKDLKTLEQRMDNILKLTYEGEEVSQTEAGALCVLPCEKDTLDEFNQLNLTIQTLKEAPNCSSNFKLNKKRYVTAGIYDYYTRNNHDSHPAKKTYEVTRRSDYRGNVYYSIPIYMSFTPKKNNDNHGSKYDNYKDDLPCDEKEETVKDDSCNDKEQHDNHVCQNNVSEYYFNKVRKCINIANKKFIGPNGEKLKIEIKSEKPQNSESHNYKIEIIKNDDRSNDRYYAGDIDCATITHEVLHLLGFTDSYQEQNAKIQYYVGSINNGCQSQPIFSNEEDAKRNCGEDNYITHNIDACRVIQEDNFMGNHPQVWKDKMCGNKPNTPENSLLTPAQFQAILYGNCPKNKNFNICSDLAYPFPPDAIPPKCLETKKCCEKNNLLDTVPEDPSTELCDF